MDYVLLLRRAQSLYCCCNSAVGLTIRQKVLGHSGGFYCYRLHAHKLKKLCNGFTPLAEYLQTVFDQCPDQYFNSGPRSSALKFRLPLAPNYVAGHEVSTLASWGLLQNKERYRDAHSKVQMFMLENDNNTIAMEVPLWLHAHEFDGYQTIFQSNEPLSGHIDVLRLEDEKIWIWDYKPNAHKEKYAATQVYFYAIMLSKRTGIPLEQFRCGYFDHNHSYVFKPEQNILLENSTLQRFGP